MTPEGARIRNVLRKVIEETTADVDRFEGRPFDGRTVSEYFAHHSAAIVTLAKALEDLLLVAPTVTDAQAQAGAALYWSLYFAKIEVVKGLPNTVMGAFGRAQQVFGTSKLRAPLPDEAP